MADVTLSAGTCAKNSREVHEGVYASYFKYELQGVTLSASNVVVMGYIPQGVTVLDGWIWGLTSNLATQKVGTIASISALSGAISCSAAGITRFAGFVPRQFSISADAEGNLARIPIAVKMVACSATITGSLNLVLILAKDTPL